MYYKSTAIGHAERRTGNSSSRRNRHENKLSRCHVYPIGNVRQYGWILAVLFGFLIHTNAQAFSLTVKGSDGTVVTGYRWTLEEDTTKPSVPGVPAEPGVNYSLSFHTSYMPVVTKSNQAINDIAVDATKWFKLIVEGLIKREWIVFASV